MSTLSPLQQTKIATMIAGMSLAKGLGSKHSACSVAAINLALSGILTDKIPECMSEIVGAWIIEIQDEMPGEIRNSVQWRNLLPNAAGTGRDFDEDKRRVAMILEWMWKDVLAQLLTTDMEIGVSEVVSEMLASKKLPGYSLREQLVHEAAVWNCRTRERFVSLLTEIEKAGRMAAVARLLSPHDRPINFFFTVRTVAHLVVALLGRHRNHVDVWKSMDPCGLLARLIAVV